MSYKVCIFDLDGTLTDPFIGVTNAFRYALKGLGINEEPENPERFIGPPLHESFSTAYNLSDADTAGAVEIFREYYSKTGLYENEVYPGIIKLLQDLKSKEILLAVATSKYEEFAVLVLKHFDLYKYFDYVSGDSYDGSLSKGGKGEIIRIALNAADPGLGKPAIMIGDRKHDIHGARDNGIDSAGITWGYGSRAELEKSGATWIIDSTDELCRLIIS